MPHGLALRSAMRALERALWQRVVPVLLVLFQASSTPEYKFANVFDSAYTQSVDETGTTTDLGNNAAGTVHSFSTPTTVIGRAPFLFDWSNFVLAGTQFMARPIRGNPVRLGLFATESSASVSVTVDGTEAHTPTVAASTAVEISGDYIGTEMVITSDAPILASVVANAWEFVALPPMAQSVYGQCSKKCDLEIWGGDKTVQIQRRCTNGSIDFVVAGRYVDGVSNYNGVSCKWTAPTGHKISGVSSADGFGWDATSLVPPEHFQLVTPLPAYMHFLLLISEGAAQCTYDSNVVTLTGANGIYHARLAQVAAGTVIECDLPVTAIGDASCPASFQSSCSNKEMNLIAAPLTTTTTTTTTTTSTTQTTTTTTSTTSTSTTTSSTSRTTTTTSSSTTTSSTTRSTTTTTTTTATTTTTSSTSSSTTMTTTTTTTTETITTTSTTTSTATTTSTTTSSSSVTETSTTTSSSSVTETTLTFTSTTFTSTATTTSLTTTSSSMTGTTTTSTTTTSSNTTTTTSTTRSATSTTVTDTSTVSTMTTSTATSTATEAPATALVGRVELLEASILPAFLESNMTTVYREEDGLSFTATKLNAAMAATGGDLLVPLGDSGVQVALPASLFAFLGLNEEDVVLTIATVDLASGGFFGSADESREVANVVNVNLRTLTGTRIAVVDLVDPITVSMPVNRSTGLQCVFWDEFSLGWATKGVQLSSVDDGLVECKSTHLTLFAAIFRGFVNAFKCSQVTLLTAESIRELGTGDWDRTPGAAVLWFLVMAFLLLLSVAAYLDWVRERQGITSYEHFLIPTEGMPEDVRLELLLEQEEREKEENKGDGKEVPRGVCACATCSAMCVAVGSWLLDTCRSSGAVRDALDEVCSEWIDYFGEIRDFVEGMTEGMELCNGGITWDKFYVLVHHVMCMTLVMSAQRQAAAHLGVSGDVSALVMQDEDMFDVLLAHHTRKTPGPGGDASSDAASNAESSNAASTPPANATSNGQPNDKGVAREDNWAQLHREFEAKLDTFMEATATWSSLPGTVWRIFLHQNPFSSCLVHCAFTSSKLRALLFMVDVMGAIMLATAFFTASGVPRKKSRQQDCEFDNPLEYVGRILAIATASVVIAGIPTIIFGSLLTRGIKKFDYEGCPEWNRQLDIWRIQDKALWILGSLYLAFCVFFISLFLANVDVGDHGDWLATGLISVVEEILIIPLVIALALPLLAGASLRFMSTHMKVKKEELISERQVEFKREGNLTLPVVRV